MLVALIIACEIGFWILVFLGLATRYILKKKRMGAFLLLLTPIVDMILLITTVIDLRGGAEASSLHGLAAVYIGISLSFGPKMIRWADERFAHRFANGPSPLKPPKYGRKNARHERKGWYAHLRAWIIGSLLLYFMTVLIGDSNRTMSLISIIKTWGIILFIDFLYSFSFTLWPRKENSVL